MGNQRSKVSLPGLAVAKSSYHNAWQKQDEQVLKPGGIAG